MTTENETVQPIVEEGIRPGTPESEAPMSGYMDSTGKYYSPEQDTGVLEQDNQDSTNLVQELSNKLGIDPSTIGQEEQFVPEPQLNTDEWYQKYYSGEKQKNAEAFKEMFGIDPREVYGLVQNTSQVTQGLEQWRREVQAKQQLETLQSEWGTEFNDVMPQVLQRFEHIRKVNPKQAQALDNVDGARMLAALIKQEASKSSMRNTPTVPQYFPNRREINHGQSNKVQSIKMSDYVNMSDAQANELTRGIQSGQIQIIQDL